MKKVISLLLALVLCLSLCACGGGNETPNTTEAPTEAKKIDLKIIGTWKTDPSYNDYVLVINDDNTGSLSVDGGTESLTWTYDEATCTLTLTKANSPDTTLMYVEENDTLVSTGPTFMRAE